MKRTRLALLLVFGMLAALLPLAALPAGAAGHISISEIRIDQFGSDIDEYFELEGPAGASLDGLTYLVIGDGPLALGSGVVEEVTDLGGLSIPSSGFFVAAESSFTLGKADSTTEP